MYHNKLNQLTLLLFLFVNVVFVQSQEKRKHAVQLLLETEENDAKTVELGDLIEASIFDKKTKSYMSLMDAKGFRVNMENNNYSFGSIYGKEVFKGFLKGLESLPQKIISEVESGSYYDFVSYRYDEEGNFYSVLFRLFSEETGLNYHDYKVSKSNGSFKFSDIYIYTSGEYISETLSRVYTIASSKKKKSKKKNKNLKELLILTKSLKMVSEGKVAEAYKLINSIKGKLSKDRYYFLIKNQISSLVSDKEYQKTMKEMLVQFPDDNKLALNYIDYYLLLEDYDKTLETINNLQTQTEDDFLFYMKGNVEYIRNDYKKSTEHYKYITENYPDFFTGYTGLIGSLSYEGKYEDAVAVLQDLVEQDYIKEELINFIEEEDENGLNELENLVKSEEFQKWK
ncbi:MAG: hypothetical protein L3J14_08425 [Flavobacteriaceae bacterium]|nr:hypothetical protein [Flavobacteriaceae bacterium]